MALSTVGESSNGSAANAILACIPESLPTFESKECDVVAMINIIPVPVLESKVESVGNAESIAVYLESSQEVPSVASHNIVASVAHGSIKALPKITENIFTSNGASTPKRRILQDIDTNKLRTVVATTESVKNIPESSSKLLVSQDLDTNKLPEIAISVPKTKSSALDVINMPQELVTSSQSASFIATSACNDTSAGVFAPLMAKRKLMKSPVRWSAEPTNDSVILAGTKGADAVFKSSDSRNLDDSIGHFVQKYKWHILAGVGCIILFTITLIVTIATVVSLSSTYYVVSHNQYPSNPQVNIDPQYKHSSPIYTSQQQDIIMQEFQNILSNPSYGLMDYGTPTEQIFKKQHLPKLANLLRQTIVKIIYSPVWFIGNSVKAAWSGINRLLNLKPKNV